MKYLWVFLTACLVGIIYYNSSLPLKQSSEISGWFAALTQLLAQHLDIHLAGDVEHHIRKMAHFCEFALLGLLLQCSGRVESHSNRLYPVFGFVRGGAGRIYPKLFAGTCLQGDGCAAGFQRCLLHLAGIPHLAVVPKIIKHGRLQLGADRRWAAAFCCFRVLVQRK